MDLSVCIPVYNGESTIERLIAELEEKLTGLTYEVVLVNDGSRDNSEAVCVRLAEEKENIKFIALRKNFGEHNAVMCGLNYCEGEYTAIIDDDFQNPPSEILKLLEEARKGYDVVYSKYRDKKHHWFRNWGSRVNDQWATMLLNKPKNLYLSSFKVIQRDVVKEIIKYRGPFPYVDGLLLRVTRNISSVFVEHEARNEGVSNYTLGKLLTLWLNMFINFSIIPLRAVSLVGAAISVVCFLLSVFFIVEKIIDPTIVMGWSSLIVTILFIGGVQMIFLGLLGEYVGKNYLDRNGTPQWVIKKEYL